MTPQLPDSRRPSPVRRILLASILLCSVLAPGLATAQTTFGRPELAGIDIEEHLGDTLPKGLSFIGENGEAVPLDSLFDGQTPVVLVLAYYECPLLCTRVLNGLVDVVGKAEGVTPGDDYRIVTISIDPEETPELARGKKRAYTEGFDKIDSPDDWRFLTGTESQIEALAKAVGFTYYYDASKDEYAHPAMLSVLTGKARISNYLYGIGYDPRDLRLAVQMAAADKVGDLVEHLGDPLPKDLSFVDQNGKTVTSAELFDGKKPVVMTLSGYSDPAAVSEFHKGLMLMANNTRFMPGRDYRLVSVSLNPTQSQETSQARATALLDQAPTIQGLGEIQVLTTDAATLQQLADAIGVSYLRDEARNEYAYHDVLVIMTPDGQISRYLDDTLYAFQSYKFALIEAGKGRVGSVIERLLLSCYHYDPNRKGYYVVAYQVMKLGGMLTLAALLTLLVVFWSREPVFRFLKRGRQSDTEPKTP